MENKINTQEELNEYRVFQQWIREEMNETMQDVYYAVKDGDKQPDNGSLLIEVYQHVLSESLRQSDFSIGLFRKYAEAKRKSG